MKKDKFLNKAVMIISAALVIGTSGVVFAAANETMLMNEIDRTMEVAANNILPPAVQSAVNTDAPDFTSSDYTVNDVYANSARPSGQPGFPEAAMTAQEAADIAAEYLWQVFSYSSKGLGYEMYSEIEPINLSLRGKPYDVYDGINPLAERAVWNGDVLANSGDLIFMFSMDAITGEILSAHKEALTQPESPATIRIFNSAEGARFWNENREEFLGLAKNYANKHLGTEIVSAEFEATIARGLPVPEEVKEALDQGLPLTDEMLESQMGVNEAGEKAMLVQNNLMDIRVTDTTGREIIVSITDNTKELFEIYNADAIPPVDLERNAQLRTQWGYK
ncbi:MAG: hypothetical protein LBV08_08560 [Clostridiales bacterium]|nr:hypothetical protein [Clostridiales bacterium]